MPSSTLATIASLTGWSYLPDIFTRLLLSYVVYPYLNRRRSSPSSPTSKPILTQTHYRLTFTIVVISYLLYNFVKAHTSTPPNFYELLNVRPNVDENGLKTAFKTFVRTGHPDKVGVEGEELFMKVREGYEALMDPTKRWAYDRFGPESLHCRRCVTPSDYLYHGLTQSLGFHIFMGLMLLFFSAIGMSSGVAFWRYILFFALMASELALLFSPSPRSQVVGVYGRRTNFLSALFPTRVPFQHIKFLHQIFMFLSIALSRVAPVLFPGLSNSASDPSSRKVAENARAVAEKVSSLEKQIVALLEQEMTSLREHPLLRASSEPPSSAATAPDQGQGQRRRAASVSEGVAADVDERTMKLLSREMERMVIEGRLNSLPRLNEQGVDDGFVDQRQRVVDRFEVRMREQERAGGTRGSVFGARRGTSRMEESSGAGNRREVNVRGGGGRDEGDGTRNTNALPSPVSPPRNLAELENEHDAVLVSKADLGPPLSPSQSQTHLQPQPQSQPFPQSQAQPYPRGVSAGPKAEGVGSAAGSSDGATVRAWSPLGGVADGGGSALGLGYVRARSKSC